MYQSCQLLEMAKDCRMGIYRLPDVLLFTFFLTLNSTSVNLVMEWQIFTQSAIIISKFLESSKLSSLFEKHFIWKICPSSKSAYYTQFSNCQFKHICLYPYVCQCVKMYIHIIYMYIFRKMCVLCMHMHIHMCVYSNKEHKNARIYYHRGLG